jgi:hypothetical protein
MPLYVFDVDSKRTIYRARNTKSLKRYIIDNIDEFKNLFLAMCWNNSKFRRRLAYIYTFPSNDLFEVKSNWKETKQYIITKRFEIKSDDKRI